MTALSWELTAIVTVKYLPAAASRRDLITLQSGHFWGDLQESFFAKVFLVPNVDTVVKAKLIHLCNTSNVLNKYKSMDADFWQGGCLQWRIEYMSMVSQCPINHH